MYDGIRGVEKRRRKSPFGVVNEYGQILSHSFLPDGSGSANDVVGAPMSLVDLARYIIKKGFDLAANVEIVTSYPDQRSTRSYAFVGVEIQYGKVYVMESKNVSGTDFLSSVCWKQNHRCIGGPGIDQRRYDARSLNRVFQSQHATILFSNFYSAFQVVYGCAKIATLNCNDGSSFWRTTNRSVKASQLDKTQEIKKC